MAAKTKYRNLVRPAKSILIVLGTIALIATIKDSLPLLKSDTAALESHLATLVQGLLIASGLLFLLDLALSFQLETPSIERSLPDVIPVGHWIDTVLLINNTSAKKLQFEFKDHVPASVETDIRATKGILLPLQQLNIPYRVRATQRGNISLGPTQFIIKSPLGFWQRSVHQLTFFNSKVYPDFANVEHFALLLQDNLQGQAGLKLLHRRGEGLDFHQLREYRQGDSLRQLDWKATARVHKLISREYQDERDQTIFFVLDCGRRMRAKDGELSHFDHSLNAMLLLSSVALRQGDSVGLLAFGGAPRFLAPIKSLSNINRLLNSVYDLESTTQASDYQAATLDFLQRVKKRSLVIYMTNIRNENFAEVTTAVSLLRKNHILLIANLQESVLDKTLESCPQNFDEALTWIELNHYAAEQKRNDDLLKTAAVITVRTTPEKLPIALINSYWEIKRAGKL